MLTEDISWVSFTGNVVETNDFCGNGLSNSVKGKSIVSFVELSMQTDGTVHNTLVVTKHVALFPDWDS